MSENIDQKLLDYLLSFVTENKQELIESRLAERTHHLTLVLQDIYHSQNANAVIRTADCFGIQDIHVIEQRNEYDLNPRVVKGALKWVDLHRYNHHEDNLAVCVNRLKAKGFVTVATSPHGESVALQDLPVDQPIALMFGSEQMGLSDQAIEMADIKMHIPMYGFTESLNISVSAAICMHHITQQLRQSDIPWRLNDEQHATLKYEWIRRVLKDPDGLARRFWDEQK